MSAHFKHGFTIIETMLVLAITGVLIGTLLFGVGSSIGAQRYSDSVSSFHALLQDQYAQVNNVSNGNQRADGWTCGASAEPTKTNGVVAPGQSNCVLLGRYVGVVGNAISTATVVGYKASSAVNTSDVQTIKNNYTLGVSESSIETERLEWGAQISWPIEGTGAQDPTTPRSIAILIIRSPETGATYTFTGNDNTALTSISSATLKNMMSERTDRFPGQGSRTICIDAGVSIPERSGIYITPYASGANSIEMRSNGTTFELGEDTRC